MVEVTQADRDLLDAVLGPMVRLKPLVERERLKIIAAFRQAALLEGARIGIAAGLAWRRVAEMAVFYVDHGWSNGMRAARDTYDKENVPYVIRRLAP